MNLTKLPIDAYKAISEVHITTHHTGKMYGMWSMSTSCEWNPYCIEYAKDPEKICSKCYAFPQLNCYKKMRPLLKRNTEILTTEVLEIFPLITNSLFRFESFGDIQNETQVINYFNVCKYNPDVKFALWTKNPGIVDRAIKNGAEKPENLIIVISSPYLNVKMDISKWKWADKVFTVWEEDVAKENQVNINCGENICIECQRCYHKNDVLEINELVKKRGGSKRRKRGAENEERNL